MTVFGEVLSEDTGTVTVAVSPAVMEIDVEPIRAILGLRVRTQLYIDDTVTGVWSSTKVPPGLELSSSGLLTGVMTQPGRCLMPVTVDYRTLVVHAEIPVVARSALSADFGLWGYSVPVPRAAADERVKARNAIGRVTMSLAGQVPSGFRLTRVAPYDLRADGAGRGTQKDGASAADPRPIRDPT